MTNPTPRILVIARDTHPAFRVDVVQLFSRELGRDHAFTWVMRDGDGKGPRLTTNARGETVYVPASGLAGLRTHCALLGQIWRGTFDAVQCRDTFLIAPFYALAARLRSIPFFYWMSYPMELGYLDRAHRDFARKRLPQGIARGLIGLWGRLTLYGWTLRLARHVFVQSDEMKKDVAHGGIPADRITAVPMGVDTTRFSPTSVTPIEDARYTGRFVILYTGTLDPARRMHIPAEAVARFCARHSNAVFALIGASSPAERDAVLRPFAERGLEERVLFTDFTPLETMLRHVRRADICLAPYPADNRMLATATPTKLVEYLAMGRRIVANLHPDHCVAAQSAPALVTLCAFSEDAFAEALEQSAATPEPDIQAQADATQWVRDQRSYDRLSDLVRAVYARTITPRRARATT